MSDEMPEIPMTEEEPAVMTLSLPPFVVPPAGVVLLLPRVVLFFSLLAVCLPSPLSLPALELLLALSGSSLLTLGTGSAGLVSPVLTTRLEFVVAVDAEADVGASVVVA